MFVALGDPTATNPITAFKQGLADEPTNQPFLIRGFRCAAPAASSSCMRVRSGRRLDCVAAMLANAEAKTGDDDGNCGTRRANPRDGAWRRWPASVMSSRMGLAARRALIPYFEASYDRGTFTSPGGTSSVEVVTNDGGAMQTEDKYASWVIVRRLVGKRSLRQGLSCRIIRPPVPLEMAERDKVLNHVH